MAGPFSSGFSSGFESSSLIIDGIPVFPDFPGLAFPVDRTPNRATVLHKTSAGKKSALKLYTFPEYTYTLDIELLRKSASFVEFQQFLGFVNTVGGQGDVFLFTDPDDSSVTDQPNGTGDGSTTQFQLVRSLGGFAEPVQSVSGTPVVSLDGTPTTAFTLGSTGIVTFTSPPGNGVEVTWTGNYFWLCRLDSDNGITISKFMNGLWEAKRISFTTEKQ